MADERIAAIRAARAHQTSARVSRISCAATQPPAPVPDGVTDLNPEGWETGWQSKVYSPPGPVPDLDQWVYATVNGVDQMTGCSPTAGSNIIEYWANHGYPELDPTHSQSHHTTGVGYVYYTDNGSSTGHEYLMMWDNWARPAVGTVYLAYGRNYTELDMVSFHPHG